MLTNPDEVTHNSSKYWKSTRKGFNSGFGITRIIGMLSDKLKLKKHLADMHGSHMA